MGRYCPQISPSLRRHNDVTMAVGKLLQVSVCGEKRHKFCTIYTYGRGQVEKIFCPRIDNYFCISMMTYGDTFDDMYNIAFRAFNINLIDSVQQLARAIPPDPTLLQKFM